MCVCDYFKDVHSPIDFLSLPASIIDAKGVLAPCGAGADETPSARALWGVSPCRFLLDIIEQGIHTPLGNSSAPAVEGDSIGKEVRVAQAPSYVEANPMGAQAVECTTLLLVLNCYPERRVLHHGLHVPPHRLRCMFSLCPARDASKRLAAPSRSTGTSARSSA